MSRLEQILGSGDPGPPSGLVDLTWQPPPRLDLTRCLVIRGLGLCYAVAFLVAWHQAAGLIGERGLMPMSRLFALAGPKLGDLSARVFALPTVFWFGSTDAHLAAAAGTGLAVSLLVMCGFTSGIAILFLWVLYSSLVNAGQTFWGYGWETLLLEAGFLGIFLCPLAGGPLPRGAPPAAVIWLFRWLLFRLILGAGLIKLRGDSCWTDLTCLTFHYETQPVPNPVAWYMHQAPVWFHKFGCGFNHFVEIALPFCFFGPRLLRRLAAMFQILFQVVLIVSGNLSFLNWLTLALACALLDDAFIEWFLPARWRAWLDKRFAAPRPTPKLRMAATFAIVALVVGLSHNPVRNMLRRDQAMNASFDRLHLVNTYGMFGSVTRERHEVIVEGTADDVPDDRAKWLEYGFPVKPGDPLRRPPIISPYHYRLDWQLWFAGFSSYRAQPWLVHLVAKLLEGDPVAARFLAADPFPDRPPKWIRATRYLYRFSKPGSGPAWWVREPVGPYLPPLSRENPSMARFLKGNGLRD